MNEASAPEVETETKTAAPETSLDRQVAKYVAEVTRVEQRIVTQQNERSWQKWWIVGGAVIGLAVGFAFRPLFGVLAFGFSLYFYGTGIYLTAVHMYEARGQLELVRNELAKLRARAVAEKNGATKSKRPTPAESA